MRRVAIVSLTIIASAAHAFAQSEPKDLSALRDSFQKARAAAIAPLEKKYSDALITMKDRYTKAGDLAAALAVDSELKAISSTSAASTPPPDIAGLPLKRVTVPGFKTLYLLTQKMTFLEAETFLKSHSLSLPQISSYKQLEALEEEGFARGIDDRSPIMVRLDQGVLKGSETPIELPKTERELEKFRAKFFQGFDGMSDFYVLNGKKTGFRRGSQRDEYTHWFVTPIGQ